MGKLLASPNAASQVLARCARRLDFAGACLSTPCSCEGSGFAGPAACLEIIALAHRLRCRVRRRDFRTLFRATVLWGKSHRHAHVTGSNPDFQSCDFSRDPTHVDFTHSHRGGIALGCMDDTRTVICAYDRDSSDCRSSPLFSSTSISTNSFRMLGPPVSVVVISPRLVLITSRERFIACPPLGPNPRPCISIQFALLLPPSRIFRPTNGSPVHRVHTVHHPAPAFHRPRAFAREVVSNAPFSAGTPATPDRLCCYRSRECMLSGYFLRKDLNYSAAVMLQGGTL